MTPSLAGKRGRGASGKTPFIVACEHNDGKPGFVALQAVEGINLDTVKQFAQAHLAAQQTIHTDAFKALNSLGESHHHVAKVDTAGIGGRMVALGAYRHQ